MLHHIFQDSWWGDNPPRTFVADLQTGLVPTIAVGSPTPTFTRATTGYVLGYAAAAVLGVDDPVLLLCASGEARFKGARRVSEGVWSAYDANGVFLSTTNGASALCCDASGPLGYLAEGVRTNLCLQSQTFGTTWVNSQSSDTDNTTVAPDGTTTADTVTATAGSSWHGVYSTAVVPSATNVSFSAYIQAGTNDYVALTITDADTAERSATAVFDLALGVVGETDVGTTSGTVVGQTIEALPNGWYRCTLIANVTSDDAAPLLGAISMATAATGNTFDSYCFPIFAAATTETLIVWGAQVETASFASSYIPTTTVAVQRNADVLYYAITGNISDLAGTAYAEFLASSGTVNARIIASNGAAAVLLTANGKGAGIYDGANAPATAATGSWVTVNKAASAWGSGGLSVVLGGGTVATSAYGGAIIGTGIYIGNDGSGANTRELNGTVRNARIYPTVLSAAKLQAMTT